MLIETAKGGLFIRNSNGEYFATIPAGEGTWRPTIKGVHYSGAICVDIPYEGTTIVTADTTIENLENPTQLYEALKPFFFVDKGDGADGLEVGNLGASVATVSEAGNDETAEAGNPLRFFATIQAAGDSIGKGANIFVKPAANPYAGASLTGANLFMENAKVNSLHIVGTDTNIEGRGNCEINRLTCQDYNDGTGRAKVKGVRIATYESGFRGKVIFEDCEVFGYSCGLNYMQVWEAKSTRFENLKTQWDSPLYSPPASCVFRDCVFVKCSFWGFSNFARFENCTFLYCEFSHHATKLQFVRCKLSFCAFSFQYLGSRPVANCALVLDNCVLRTFSFSQNVTNDQTTQNLNLYIKNTITDFDFSTITSPRVTLSFNSQTVLPTSDIDKFL